MLQAGAHFERWTGPNRAGRRAEDDYLREWECKNPLQMFDRVLDRQLVGPALQYAHDVRTQIERHHPHHLVCSFFAFGAMAAAQAAGLSFDVMFPNIYLLPAEGMPPMGLVLRRRAVRWRDYAIASCARSACASGSAGWHVSTRRALRWACLLSPRCSTSCTPRVASSC